MDYTIEEIKEEYEKQVSELNSIEEEIKKVYEEEIRINEILLTIETKGDLDTLSLMNEQYGKTDTNLFNTDDKKTNFDNLKNELNQINKISGYKTFIKNNNPDNLPEKEALEQMKKNCNTKTRELFADRNLKEKLIDNLEKICDESIIDLQNELGQGSEIGSLIEQYAKLESFIEDFKVYDKFLTKENKTKLEELKKKQEEIEEQIGKNLPNVGAFISRKVQREMYAKQYTDVVEKEYEIEKKIKDFKELKEEINQSLLKTKDIPYKEMIEKLNEQQQKLSGLDDIKIVNENDMKTMDEILNKLEKEQTNKEKAKEQENTETTFEGSSEMKVKNERIKVNDLIEEKNSKAIDIPTEKAEILEENKELNQEQIDKMDEILNTLNKEENNNENESKKIDEAKEKINSEENKESNLKPLKLSQQLKENSKIERERREELEEKVVKETKDYLHPYFSKKDFKDMKSFVDSSNEIEKKVKKKTTKEIFSSRVKKALSKIKNYFVEEIDITKKEGIASEEDINDYLFTNQYGDAIIPEISEEKGKVK